MLRATQIRQHVNFMRSRGFSVDQVLENTGVDAARLPDSSYLVEVEQCHAVVSNMIRLSGNPGIGLKVGALTNLNDLGIVGYAMASASTLDQAIGLWLQYGTTPVGFPFTLSLIDSLGDGQWGVSAAPTGISGSIYRFYVEETLAMGMSFGQLLTGRPFELLEMAFSFPAPAHWQQYERRFRCTLRFDAPLTRAIVKGPPLDTPVKSNDSELRELCIRHCIHIVKRLSHHGPISYRLRNVLTATGTIPTLEKAAESLNMSARTLRRHLHKEQTSYQIILDEFRSELAREYLASGMPAKEVAFLLRFSQADAFRRAFKIWTGQTVGDFQSAENLPRHGPTKAN